MIKIIFLLFVLTFGKVFAQDSIYGKIYGEKEIAKHIKISNTIKNTTTFSNEIGNFSLKASVGDSIIFSSSFYEDKQIVIDSTHLSKTFVIQLKDKINQLDEVILKEALLEKKFNTRTYKEEFNNIINNDIKNNPWKYDFPTNYGQGINLKGFKNLLFPKKNKKKIIFGLITYDYLKKLNSIDEFFSDTFFTNELKIPKDFKFIFFEYFDDHEVSAKLLTHENRLLLIEKFFELSDKFLNIINSVKTIKKKP